MGYGVLCGRSRLERQFRYLPLNPTYDQARIYLSRKGISQRHFHEKDIAIENELTPGCPSVFELAANRT